MILATLVVFAGDEGCSIIWGQKAIFGEIVIEKALCLLYNLNSVCQQALYPLRYNYATFILWLMLGKQFFEKCLDFVLLLRQFHPVFSACGTEPPFPLSV